MASLRFLPITALVFSFSFCAKQEMLPVYDLDYGETIEHDDQLRIHFKSIADSRCPINVICVWEGQAEVGLDLVFDGDQVHPVTLIERAGHPDLADTTVQGYYIQLLEVSPYPVDTEPIDPEDYTIRIRVEN